MQFFSYESPYRTNIFMDLTFLEFTIPIILLLGLILGMVIIRDKIKDNDRLDRTIRYGTGIVFLVLYLSHYLLRFALYGWDTIVLPFQLCSISMAFAIVLLFTQNKTIYSFVLYTGVLGGLISLMTPIIGYDSHYYRYYQFYGAHLLLIVTPLYFMLIKQYYPTKRETIKAFLILQALAIFMGVFNAINGTDFMFIFVDPDKIEKFPAIDRFGGIPYYLILVEVAGILLFIGLYQITKQIKQLHIKREQTISYNN